MNLEKTLSTRFSCAHFYAQPAWTEERNRAEFGRCFTPHGHGHDYRLEATFSAGDATQDQEWRRRLSTVTETLDHQHLNFTIPEFATTVPTTENLALWIWKKLSSPGSPAPLRLRLYETDDLWVEVTP